MSIKILSMDCISRTLTTVLATLMIVASTVQAVDLTEGTMVAVPTVGGAAPVIDGNLDDWDLSASEPFWIADQTAELMSADASIAYDADALYFSVRVAMPDRVMLNVNNPTDAFWAGDMLELRLVSDPSFAYPLDPKLAEVKESNRVVHLSFWKNTQTNKDYINLAYGVGFDKGSSVNPPGSSIVVKPNGEKSYVMEARIPWSAMNVPDGKNPFGPNKKMTATIAAHWGQENQTPALYRVNPGLFAFMQAQTWGLVEFSPTNNIAKRHGTMAEAIAKNKVQPVGVPITITLEKSAKVSVNIVEADGRVVRELMGGEPHDAGTVTAYWDGRDQWGTPMPAGDYKWSAYTSLGLKAEYVGTVGTSGNPPYDMVDGKGGWGADHGEATDVAADESGLYFLWVSAEAGRAVVKTDYAGQVIWRKTPFVGGGFGPHYTMASNGKHVFATLGRNKTELLHLDAATGQLQTFANGKATVLISSPSSEATAGELPETCGLAASAGLVYASFYSENKIKVINPVDGTIVREIQCAGPRGLALDSRGDLYAVSETSEAKTVVHFPQANGPAKVIVSQGLIAPYDIAVDARGHLHVSDRGRSQQIKTFDSDGVLLKTAGKPGGRAWIGKYDTDSFLNPLGLALDNRGGLLLAEGAIPKVMSRFEVSSGKLLNRWFGSIAYSGLNIPDPQDPFTQYYPVSEGFARGRVPETGGVGEPSAYWVMSHLGLDKINNPYDQIAAPVVMLGTNGKKYLFSDTGMHDIFLVDGDKLLPVGRVATSKEGVDFWSDLNGDHRQQTNEITTLKNIAGQGVPGLVRTTGSMWMSPNGDIYLVTWANSILKIPASGFADSGAIQWDMSLASFAAPKVIEQVGQSLYCGWREGILGVRGDSKGNVFTCINAKVDYVTKDLTEQHKEGLGHTAGVSAVKFAKFGSDGKLLWMAGRKALAAAKPGEMYHFWVLAGMVGDGDYIAGASEWGQMYFYTHDGFFVDAIMNNPGLAPPAGPYTFGGETFGGRIQDFPDRKEVWAFSSGRSFRVLGFENGKVAGERRQSGSVKLDKIYDAAKPDTAKDNSPLSIVALPEGADPNDETVWLDIPKRQLTRAEQPLATVQLAYSADRLFARMHVIDNTPLENSADGANLLFKGGDCVGLDLGLVRKPNDKPILGDVRFLAAKVGGRPMLVAMKPFTGLTKKPEIYVTPAAGERKFEFVGEVPGGTVVFSVDPDGAGYTALLSIPRSFIEVPLTSGGLIAAEFEVLLSGQGARGLQVTSRNYLFTPDSAATSMTDDVPTEASLYPGNWGTAQMK